MFQKRLERPVQKKGLAGVVSIGVIVIAVFSQRFSGYLIGFNNEFDIFSIFTNLLGLEVFTSVPPDPMLAMFC
jgi:hypothetical protein